MDGILSQEEINALLNGISSGETPEAALEKAVPELVSDQDKDAVGEIANISMGTAATTLYSLVNRKVTITTPVVTVTDWEKLAAEYEKPCVFIQISYTGGLEGRNILILKEKDVKVITDLMMGGDGTNSEGELSELHLSAIGEAMNQMMGSSATSLSSMFKTIVDISPPQADLVDLTMGKVESNVSEFLGKTFIKISFHMEIEGLVNSTIMQLYPIEFAKHLIEEFGASTSTASSSKNTSNANSTPKTNDVGSTSNMTNTMSMENATNNMNMQLNNMPMQNMGMQNQGFFNQNMGMQNQGFSNQNMQNLNIQPAQFQEFKNDYNMLSQNENITLIRDVPLEVTVELGRTSKAIQDILKFAPGTIIELNKIAGEPIDVLVNGKNVAKGEVVVIDENFGVRVTEIIK